MVRWFRMALLGAAVSLAFGTLASAQSGGYDDHSYDRHDNARERGFHRGYDDGFRKGQYDADRRHRFSFKNDDWEDSRGFEHWMGDKHDYKRAYRKGYERGYREAYNNNGYGRRNRDDDRWRDRDNWR
jgi:flagellar biosynthesis/type III secretory pathway protein FliH